MMAGGTGAAIDNRVKKFSPLTEATYYILLSLEQPRHGYAIQKQVETMSRKRVRLAAGTLYGALSTLLDHNLISLVGEDGNNRKRKIYLMTDLGRDLVRYEIRRLREMVNNGVKVTEPA